MMRIMAVVGARPNFVKMAPLIHQLEKKGIEWELVHTGQHYDEVMSKVFFEQLGLPKPTRYLGVGSGTHGVQTGKIMGSIEELLMEGKYDLVLVVGDVNSTLAAALAAVKIQIPVAHVEAGYRSFDMGMPEEINRILVDRISQILFAPTETAVLNLINEGVKKERIFLVGNVMIETLISQMKHVKRPKSCNLPESYSLLTIHRAENTDTKEKMASIIEGIKTADTTLYFPMHPRTKHKLEHHGLMGELESIPNLIITEPLGYLEFQYALSNAECVLTDSGGIQEEALFHKVPCITLRSNTERMVTLRYGANRLVGSSTRLISSALKDVLHTPHTSWPLPPMWDANVSERIVSRIEEHGELLCLPSNDLISP